MRDKLHTVRKLGEGAFSTVYLVADENGRRYACKESRETKLLRQEAERMKALRHPLFPKYEGFWISEETGYLLMEYLEGETLEHYLQRTEALSPGEVLSLCRQLAEGLMLLHERDLPLLYLDLKPENVICCGQDRLRLVDLGLLTEAGVSRARAGSPGYAAPEQFCVGSLLTPAADVYGFGKTMKRLLEKTVPCTGKRRAAEGNTGTALRGLEQLAERCVCREASERFPSLRPVRDILLALESAGKSPLPKDTLAQAILTGRVQVEQSVFLP